MNRERRIREMAYHLWEQEGRPDGEGQSHQFWLAAEAQFEAAATGRQDAERVPPAAQAVEKPARLEPAADRGKAAKPKIAEAASQKPAGSGKRKPRSK